MFAHHRCNFLKAKTAVNERIKHARRINGIGLRKGFSVQICITVTVIYLHFALFSKITEFFDKFQNRRYLNKYVVSL